MDSEVRAEVDALARMGGATERRIDQLRDEIPDMVHKAVQQAMAGYLLSEEERMWVKLAIKKEAQSISLRQAIIEKSLTGLVWAAIAGLGVVMFEYLKAHGWKP
jgi:hypothetical protein